MPRTLKDGFFWRAVCWGLWIFAMPFLIFGVAGVFAVAVIAIIEDKMNRWVIENEKMKKKERTNET